VLLGGQRSPGAFIPPVATATPGVVISFVCDNSLDFMMHTGTAIGCKVVVTTGAFHRQRIALLRLSEIFGGHFHRKKFNNRDALYY